MSDATYRVLTVIAGVLGLFLVLFGWHIDISKKNETIRGINATTEKMATLIVLTPGDTLTIRETAVLGANAAIQLSQQKQQITPDSVFEMWLRLYYSRIQAKKYQDFKNRVGFEAVPDSAKTDSTQ